MEDAGEAVGRALATLVTLLNPRLIVVGGDLAATGEHLLEPVRRGSRATRCRRPRARSTIVAGGLGASAEVRGAAARVLAGAAQTLAVMSGAEAAELLT